MTRWLLADIGGTRARFALFDGDRVGPIESMATGAYASADDAFRCFLDHRKGTVPERVMIAAAGPVADGRCKLTNAPWVLETERLCHALHLRSATIVNDLEALAWAVPHLGNGDVSPIGNGSSTMGEPVAVIAPGTGLGVACYLPGRPDARVLAGEGGHATLAANDASEMVLIEILRRRFGHVSAERILSGRGLVHLHAALATRDGHEPGTPTAEDIVRGALDGGAVQAAVALDAFCGFLASFAGDVALTYAARGGVLIAGGMAPHIVTALQIPAFRARFTDKGRLADYVSRIPTGVIVRPEPTFLGLAALAARAAS
jgi:glucokinase